MKKVVNIFINTESPYRGHGVKFRYPVESLSTGERLFIFRPAGLNKWNFDFKVEVLKEFGLGKGTHEEVKSDFQNKKWENLEKFNKLLKTLKILYECSENDVDQLLKNHPEFQKSFKKQVQK